MDITTVFETVIMGSYPVRAAKFIRDCLSYLWRISLTGLEPGPTKVQVGVQISHPLPKKFLKPKGGYMKLDWFTNFSENDFLIANDFVSNRTLAGLETNELESELELTDEDMKNLYPEYMGEDYRD